MNPSALIYETIVTTVAPGGTVSILKTTAGSAGFGATAGLAGSGVLATGSGTGSTSFGLAAATGSALAVADAGVGP